MVDEAFVVIAASEDDDGDVLTFASIPFATREGAEAAMAWLKTLFNVKVTLIDDRERVEEEAGRPV